MKTENKLKRTYFLKIARKGGMVLTVTETCGHCRDLDQCLHVNGNCLICCESDLQNEFCEMHANICPI